MRKLAILAFSVLLAACSENGGKFEGQWLETSHGTSMLDIQRNGSEYLISASNPKSRRDKSPAAPVPAVLKDGKLVLESTPNQPSFTYVEAKDTLVFASVAGTEEYRRVKN